MLGNSSGAVQQAASQEWTSSMELVSYVLWGLARTINQCVKVCRLVRMIHPQNSTEWISLTFDDEVCAKSCRTTVILVSVDPTTITRSSNRDGSSYKNLVHDMKYKSLPTYILSSFAYSKYFKRQRTHSERIRTPSNYAFLFLLLLGSASVTSQLYHREQAHAERLVILQEESPNFCGLHELRPSSVCVVQRS
jgi:hypothetical protein